MAEARAVMHEVAPKLAEYSVAKAKYERTSNDLQMEAKREEAKCDAIEMRALYFDFGEGLLEIGLVLSSLYFIARRKLFPKVGIVGGVFGMLLAIAAFFIG